MARCQSGSSCTNTAYFDWSRNGPGTPFQYHAEIQYNGKTVARSEDLVVPVERKHFAVSMGFSLFDTNFWNSAAYTSPTTAGTGLTTLVEKSDGTVVARCHYYTQGEPCPSGFVGPGTYRTRVVDGNDFSSGHSPWYTLDDDGVHSNLFGGVDLIGLAALLRSGAASETAAAESVCVDIAAAPSVDLRWSTVNDLYFPCEAAKNDGLTVGQILARIAALTGGIQALTWIEATETDEAITAPSTYPPTHEGDGDENDPRPVPVPPIHYAPSSGSEVDDVLSRNRDQLGSDRDLAERLRNRCVAMRVESAGRGLSGDVADPEKCDSLPIFVAGSDYRLVSEHDRDAIVAHPQWGLLHREEPAHSRSWLQSRSECDGNSPQVHCDEYPFATAQEGGQDSSPLPSLRLVPGLANAAQAEC